MKTNFLEDTLKLKKGKFRHASKAFWMKRSDFARSRWSRASRYGNLTNRFSDAKLNRSYKLKHTLSNFLMWKLGVHRSELNLQMQQSCPVSNQFLGSFSIWLLNRLNFVLLISGFCANMSLANQIIVQKQVLVNGVPMTDLNYQIQPGDFITILKPLQFTQSEYSNFLAPNCLQPNHKTRAIVVLKTLSLNAGFAITYLNQLQVNYRKTQKVGSLMDPFASILLHFEALFGL